MRINLTSVLIDDQDKALRSYTDVLGFEKKIEVALGQQRWLTVVSPDDPDGTELVLERDEHPAAKPFKAALVRDGIPFSSLPSTMSSGSSSGSRNSVLGSRRSRHRWVRRPSSTTPAAT